MKTESWLRRKIERKLYLRFHFFEDGWEVNKEFMRWKLKNYWGYITCLRHSGLSWFWGIPCSLSLHLLASAHFVGHYADGCP